MFGCEKKLQHSDGEGWFETYWDCVNLLTKLSYTTIEDNLGTFLTISLETEISNLDNMNEK